MINASVRENGKEKNIGEFERRILYMTLLKHRNVCYCCLNRCLTVVNNVASVAHHVVAIGCDNDTCREGHLSFVYKEQFLVDRIEKMIQETLFGRLNLIETDVIDVGVMEKGP